MISLQRRGNNLFTFDEKEHLYLLDGVSLPSVTQILNSEGIIGGQNNNGWYMLKGKYLHQAIKLYLDNNLDEDTLDPQLNITGFKKFLKDSGIKVKGYERPFYHPKYFYAGTPDLWGDMKGGLYLVDIKTGSPKRWHSIQLSAYERMLQAHQINISGCANLYLDGDNYNLKLISAMERIKCWDVFISAFTVYKWKQEN